MRCAIIISILFAWQSALAQNGPVAVSTVEPVLIQVRSVRALKEPRHRHKSTEINEHELRHFSAAPMHGAGGAPDIDSRLSDLREKLLQLPYRQYRLLATQQVEVPMDRKHEITLAGGEALKVRLLYVNREKVGMWLRWEDSSGAELLDTRMHFNCHESMVTGTDINDHTGSILAVRVLPKP